MESNIPNDFHSPSSEKKGKMQFPLENYDEGETKI